MRSARPNPVCLLDLEVQPRASRAEVVGWREGRLRVRVKAPPVDGAANAAVVELVAARLGVPRGQVTIVAGASGRRKRLRVEGLSPAAVERTLGRG